MTNTEEAKSQASKTGVTMTSNISTTSVLSSPDIIKSVSRNLTPPIPPTTFVAAKVAAEITSNSPTIPISDPLIDVNWPGRPKRNSVGVHTGLPPINANDDYNASETTSPTVIIPPRRQRRQMSSPTLKKISPLPAAEIELNGKIVKSPLQINIAAAQNSIGSQSHNSDYDTSYQPDSSNNNSAAHTSSSTYSGKPPIFPLPSSSTTPLVPKYVDKPLRTKMSENNNEPESPETMPAFMKEFVMRRKNSQRDLNIEFNPDEKIPPPHLSPGKRTMSGTSVSSVRPHSAFIPRSTIQEFKGSPQSTIKCDIPQVQFKSSESAGESCKPLVPSRRRSDFVMRYENLMNRAETALKSVDNYETVTNKEKKKDTESRIGDNITTSKISPTDAGTNYEGSNDEDEEVGEIDFNEEEVLQKCRDFLNDYDKNKRRISSELNKNKQLAFSYNANTPPTPKPRQNVGFTKDANIVVFESPITADLYNICPENSEKSTPSIRARSSSLTLPGKRFQGKNVENEANCCPNNKYYETSPDRSSQREPLRSENTVPAPRFSMPKPILKKSSEDLIRISDLSEASSKTSTVKSSNLTEKLRSSGLNPTPEIAMNVSSILKQRNSLGESIEHSTPTNKHDHVRIRSPSPDLDDFIPKPILRSRNNSVGACTSSYTTDNITFIGTSSRNSSPELGGSGSYGGSSVSFQPQSILKRRSSEAEDLDTARSYGGDMSGATSGHTSGATSRSSPEPPHGILKQRKWSVGSGSRSPDNFAMSSGGNSGTGVSISGAIISSILKKRGSSQHSSHQGSLEDLTSGGSSLHDGGTVKSILKKTGYNSSGHASNASGIGCSTDDELEEHFECIRARTSNHPRKPGRSILKSRRSEESLSPLSDPNFYESATTASGNMATNGVEFSDGVTNVARDSIEAGIDTSFSKSPGIRPILKRDKSKSPTRGSTSTRSMSPLDGSSGFSSGAATTPGATSSSTPPIIANNPSNYGAVPNLTAVTTNMSSSSPRRSSLTFSPIKKCQQIISENEQNGKNNETSVLNDIHEGPIRKTSFVSQKFIELSPGRKFSSGNSTTIASQEKLPIYSGSFGELVDRVTFSTEQLKMTDTKEDSKINECTNRDTDIADGEDRLSPNQENENTNTSVHCNIYGSILKRKSSRIELLPAVGGSELEPDHISLPMSTLQMEESSNLCNPSTNVLPRVRKKSILRKDSSYEDNLRPILKNNTEAEHTTECARNDNSSKSEARILSPKTTSKIGNVEKCDNALSNNSEEDESSDEIQSGPFSDVIIDKPTSATSSLHNLDDEYVINDDENFENKLSPLEDENLEDEEIRQIFGGKIFGSTAKEFENKSSRSSSEDLEELGLVSTNSAFNDVIIDPIPGATNIFTGSGSALNSPIRTATSSSRKTSLAMMARQPVISPSSVKISADGNLADKLQVLSETADTIKMRMRQSSNFVMNSVIPEPTKVSQIPTTVQSNSTKLTASMGDLSDVLPPSGFTPLATSQNKQPTVKERSSTDKNVNNSAMPPLNKR